MLLKELKHWFKFHSLDAYSQMSDSNGQLIATKFEDFMRQCFFLTAAVGEEPSFHYKPGLARDVFPNVGNRKFVIGFYKNEKIF